MTETRHDEKRYKLWKWWILVAVMFSYLFYYLGRFNLGICARPIAEEFGWTTGQVGRIISVLILTYGIGQFINGQFADRYGRIMIPLGAVLSLIANWGFSFAPEIGGFVGKTVGAASAAGFVFGAMMVLWGINGYCQSLAMPACGRWVSNWWIRKERGLALGLYSFSACLSTITVFNLAAYVADKWGWRASFRFPVIIMAVVPVLFYFLTKDFPEQVGLESRENKNSGHREATSIKHYTDALKNKSFVLMCCSIGCNHMVRWGLLSFLPAFFMEVAGWKIKGAGFVTSALPLGMAFGALSGGYVSDKLFHGKRANIIFISMIFCAICSVLIPRITVTSEALEKSTSAIAAARVAQDAGGEGKLGAEARKDAIEEARIVVPQSRKPIAIAMLLISGFMLYTSMGPYMALCPDLLGVDNAGTGFGIFDAFAYGGAALGTFVLSWILDGWGYAPAFYFMGGCGLAAALLIKCIRE